MNPALSVIFFSVLSGTGYGLWFWWASSLLGHDRDFGFKDYLTLAVGAGFVILGLLCSTLHLGQKMRAWRAFSQWRTAWLSREGLAAVLCFIPVILIAFVPQHGTLQKSLAIAIMCLCTVTVYCTAKIYHCLKTVPAWQHNTVVPLYLFSALYSGGLWLNSIFTVRPLVPVVILLSGLVFFLMGQFWRNNDNPLSISRSSALGLPESRDVHVFENPHTEANFISKEMVHVLARKHSTKLRMLCSILAFAVPSIACVLGLIYSQPLLYSAAAIFAMIGLFIGRWLFFAEAKHVVSLYY